MKWFLAKKHLSNPTLPAVTVLLAMSAAFEPALAMPEAEQQALSAFSLGGFWILLAAVALPMVFPASTVFEHTLPLHARVVREGRWLAACVVLGIPFIAWGVSARLHFANAWPVVRVLSMLCVAVMFAMLVYLTTTNGPRLLPRRSVHTEILLRVAILLALCAAAVYMLTPELAFATLTGLAVAMYVVLTRQIPASVPFAFAVRRRVEQWSVTSRWRTRARDSDMLLVMRSAWLWARLMIAAIAFGAAASGYSGHYISISLAGYTVLFGFLFTLNMRWMALLPISSGRRAALMYGPMILLIITAFAIGNAVGIRSMPFLNSLDMNGRYTDTPGEWYASPSRIALVYWHATTLANQPVITAPWGEATPADTITVFGTTRFNPYTSRTSNTARFIDWQVARATQVVYGQSFTQAEYDALSESELPGIVTRQPRAVFYGYTLVVLQIILSLWLVEALRWHRFNRLTNRTRYALLGFALVAIMVVPIGIRIAGYPNTTSGYFLERLMLGLLENLPGAWPWSVGIAVVLVLAAWRLVVWQCAQSEWAPKTV